MSTGVETYGVVTFQTTYSVLKAEKIFKEAGLQSVRLIPVPSQVSSDCGVTVRFLIKDLDQVRILLEKVRNDLEGLYEKTPKGWDSLPL